MIKRVVIAGSRNYTNYEEAKNYIDHCLKDVLAKYDVIVVSGGCKGADLLGEKYASERGLKIERYPARWELYGKYAGPKRNAEMAQISDYIICFWDGKSKGTKSMIEFAKDMGKPIRIKKIDI